MTVLTAILFSVHLAAFGMGSDSKNRSVAKKCREFRDAVREGNLEKVSPFFSATYLEANKDKIKEPTFFQQKQRLLTKIFINEKYRPADSIFLPRSQFRAVEGNDGSMLCLVSKNGEDENPELHTVRSMRLIQENSEWKISELKIHEGW